MKAERARAPLQRLTSFKIAALAMLMQAFAVTAAPAQQPLAAPSAVPIDPIAAIVDAFKTHSVVALGEGNHGNEQAYAFRLALIKDPRFSAVVNDIVVESGDAFYQDVMDRFTRGEDVPDKELRPVWQNTTQNSTAFDRPIYEGFFRAVRAVNASLPKDRQLRVLLGDPPMDWTKIHSADDLLRANVIDQRDSYPADTIQREVLAKGRRALVVYGDLHFLRRNLYLPLQDRAQAEQMFNAPVHSIVAMLEMRGISVFSVWTNTTTDLTPLQPNIFSWPAPSLAVVRDTSLGLAPFTFYFPFQMNLLHDGIREQVNADPIRSSMMQDQFDAVLYLGPPTAITQSRLTPALCADPDYVQMRLQRFAWENFPGDPGAAFKAECARAAAP